MTSTETANHIRAILLAAREAYMARTGITEFWMPCIGEWERWCRTPAQIRFIERICGDRDMPEVVAAAYETRDLLAA